MSAASRIVHKLLEDDFDFDLRDEIEQIKAPKTHRWKIQQLTFRGWADVKVSTNRGWYRTLYFGSEAGARAEIAGMRIPGNDDDEYRVVSEEVPQEFDLYEDEDDFRDEIEAIPVTSRTVTRIDGRYTEDGDLYDHDTHDPVVMELDEYDIEDGKTLTDIVVRHLVDDGACFASSSHFHPGVWYDGQSEFIDDGSQQSSWHLKGFSEEEEEAIFKSMMGR